MYRNDDPSRSAVALRDLLAHERALIERELLAAAAGEALLVDALDAPTPQSTHAWLTLRMQDGAGLRGFADADEGVWPLGEGSIEVIFLRHALEHARAPQAMLGEALRVLAPGGLLLITGIQPWSPWRSWLARHAEPGRRPRRMLSPGYCRQSLRAAGANVGAISRFGSIWPGLTTVGEGSVLAAAYLLSARKERAGVTPIGRAQFVPRARIGALPGLANLAHRLAA